MRRSERNSAFNSELDSLCVCPLFSCFSSLRFILLAKLRSRVLGCTVVHWFYTVDLERRRNGRWYVPNCDLTNLIVVGVGVGVVGERAPDVTRPDWIIHVIPNRILRITTYEAWLAGCIKEWLRFSKTQKISNIDFSFSYLGVM